MSPPAPATIDAEAKDLVKAVEELASLLSTEPDVITRALAVIVRKQTAFQRLRNGTAPVSKIPS